MGSRDNVGIAIARELFLFQIDRRFSSTRMECAGSSYGKSARALVNTRSGSAFTTFCAKRLFAYVIAGLDVSYQYIVLDDYATMELPENVAARRAGSTVNST